ncbi:MAG: SH3 domain-containing protein [Thermomicrobiales bacterium]
MKGALRLMVMWVTVAGMIGFAPLTRAQEATPARGHRRQIELQDRRLLTYSPDGTMLETYRASRGKDQLCVVDVATSQDKVCGDLSGIRAGLREEDVVWSPDGSKLALAEESFQTFIDGDVWVMDVATGAITNVADDGYDGKILLSEDTDQTFSIDVLPAWRPDGKALAVSRSPYRNGQFRGNQIIEIPLDGSKPTTLLPVTLEEPGVVHFGMLYSGDGSHLFFTVAHSSPDNPQNGLWIADSDGKNPRQVIGSDPDLGPPVVIDVTPAGDKTLVFHLQAAMQFANRGPYYAIVDTKTGQKTPIELGLPDQNQGAFVSMATLSPDGTKLLTVSRATGPEGIAAVRDVDGGNVEQVGEPITDAALNASTRGIEWATNGTAFVPRGLDKGTIIEVPGGTSAVTPEPAFKATPATTGSPSGEIAPGTTVVTNDANVAMRAAPSTSAPIVLELDQGMELTIIGPEVTGDRFLWWPVMDPKSQTLGYVRAEFLSSE